MADEVTYNGIRIRSNAAVEPDRVYLVPPKPHTPPKPRPISEILKKHFRAEMIHFNERPERWLIHPDDLSELKQEAAEYVGYGDTFLVIDSHSIVFHGVRMVPDTGAMRIGGR